VCVSGVSAGVLKAFLGSGDGWKGTTSGPRVYSGMNEALRGLLQGSESQNTTMGLMVGGVMQAMGVSGIQAGELDAYWKLLEDH
jgi:hypothetical protein